MISIENYKITEELKKGKNAALYSGQKNDNKKPVLIKVLNTDKAAPSEKAILKHEIESIRNLKTEGIVRIYDIKDTDEGIALIMEDFEGKPLIDIIKKEKVDIDDFLKISIELAQTLGEIHKNNIIHKDIRPHNILINRETGKVKIANFGIVKIITKEDQNLYNPEVIEEFLPYISPEQTGRMNRSVDYRTDIYSIGITLYEMLAGDVPFSFNDPMELIHSHIAKEPIPPAGGIPKPVSDIVMKLISKTAEERYQSGYGLKADLEECLHRLRDKGAIDDFTIGNKDISDRFQIPEKLYGREEEIEELMSAFQRVSRGNSEMMMVAGFPGIGKTALINEIDKPVVRQRGYFISGKFEQYMRDTPYSAMIQAFERLVRHILSESTDRIQDWKDTLIDALTPNGQVIVNVIPEVELIIGKQPEVPELGPEESQNRFNLYFQRFIRVFASKDHPLVMFLDDLQWADLASLSLINTLITDPESEFLFLIGAYRDNEVSASHPLIISLDEIKKEGVDIKNISLDPLKQEDVKRIIIDTLKCSEEKALSLSGKIYNKTAGNPFFVKEFLKSLYGEKILKFNYPEGWSWDIEKIDEIEAADDVVELMAGKISNLTPATQDVLKIASCIGNKFSLELLTDVSDKPIDEGLSDLQEAEREGLIYISGYTYCFFHDRIQEAAYSLISEDERVKMHLKIGRIVLGNTGKDELSEKIFYIVDQLNQGIDLISEQEERIKLAELNLLAGEKSKESTGYSSAVNYLRTGVNLLPEDAWKNNYELTYSLFRERVESEHLNRNFDEAENIFNIIINKAKNNIDKADVYLIMVTLYSSTGKFDEALGLGLKCLKMFGIKLSVNPSKLLILLEIIKAKWNLRNMKNEDLIDMPEMKDVEKLAAVSVMVSMAAAAHLINPELLALMGMIGFNFYLKYGNADSASLAYLCYGITMGEGFSDYELCYRFHEIALRFNKRINNKKINSHLYFTIGYLIIHWRKHARNNIKFFQIAYENGLETGDFIYSAHCHNAKALYRSMIGDNLDDIFQEYKKFEDFQYRTKDTFVIDIYLDNNQMYLNLKGLTRSKCSLSSGDYNEEKRLKSIREENNPQDFFIYFLTRLRILYLFCEYADCYEIVTEMEQVTYKPIGTLYVAEYYFHYSLTLTALYTDASGKEKRKYSRIIKKNQKKMKKWSDNCPENFLHKYLLVSAEMAAISGNNEEAMKLYEESIESAHENEYIQNEAIANELAANFYLKKEMPTIAKAYMQEAHKCYSMWGASAKVKDLEERYPKLLEALDKPTDKAEALEIKSIEPDKEPPDKSSALDIQSVMKASQALSSEIKLDKLLQNIMRISIENAGAQKGFLILEREGNLLIEAEADASLEKIDVLNSIPLEDCKELSSAIVHYVHRTKENLLLNDAANEGNFTNDDYILKNKPKSILCGPIRQKGKVAGIVYFENNLTTNAFTPERLEMLRILSSQVAISLENALLYNEMNEMNIDLENRVKERTSELQKTNEKLLERNIEIEGELETARLLQQRLLPEKIPEISGYESHVTYIPMDKVGGDFYDYRERDNFIELFIADVSGHGLPGAFLSMITKMAFESIKNRNSTKNVFYIINDVICKSTVESNYVTTFYCIIDRETNIMKYSNAGHFPPLIYRQENDEFFELRAKGNPLGWFKSLKLEEKKIQLNAGDRLILYTDGITECMDSNRKEFGEDGFKEFIRSNKGLSPKSFSESLLTHLKEFSGSDRFDDDLCLLVFDIL